MSTINAPMHPMVCGSSQPPHATYTSPGPLPGQSRFAGLGTSLPYLYGKGQAICRATKNKIGIISSAEWIRSPPISAWKTKLAVQTSHQLNLHMKVQIRSCKGLALPWIAARVSVEHELVCRARDFPPLITSPHLSSRQPPCHYLTLDRRVGGRALSSSTRRHSLRG